MIAALILVGVAFSSKIRALPMGDKIPSFEEAGCGRVDRHRGGGRGDHPR